MPHHCARRRARRLVLDYTNATEDIANVARGYNPPGLVSSTKGLTAPRNGSVKPDVRPHCLLPRRMRSLTVREERPEVRWSGNGRRCRQMGLVNYRRDILGSM
eukprot:7186065-Heterocapsa_arctica.AAC.1